MTAAQDAAVLYFALHGTDAPLTCQFLNEGGETQSQLRGLVDSGMTRCGMPLAGLDHDDGAPLCETHLQSEGGHPLDFDTIAELWLVKRTLDVCRNCAPRTNLEAFAQRVADIESKRDTIPAPPPSTKRTVEAKTRGHLR